MNRLTETIGKVGNPFVINYFANQEYKNIPETIKKMSMSSASVSSPKAYGMGKIGRKRN